jgi:hypothetical protein
MTDYLTILTIRTTFTDPRKTHLASTDWTVSLKLRRID